MPPRARLVGWLLVPRLRSVEGSPAVVEVWVPVVPVGLKEFDDFTLAVLSAVALIVAVSLALTVTTPPAVAVTPVIRATASPWTLLSTTRPPIASDEAGCGVTVPVLAALLAEGSPVGATVSVAGVAAAGFVPLPVPVPVPAVGSFSPSGMKFDSSARFQSSLLV